MKYDILTGRISPKREPVSKSQKDEVLARQKNRCARCGKELDSRFTQFDHIKRVSDSGKSRIDNLQALCANDHMKKTHEERLEKVEKRRKSGKGLNVFTTGIRFDRRGLPK